MSDTDVIRVDVAVIGAGLAGLATALSLAGTLKVAVFAKRPLGKSASTWAQGGIAAVRAADDDIESHYRDTDAAGAGLGKPDVIRTVVSQAGGAIDWLQENGVRFNTDAGGALDLAREGGHSRRRIVHVDDRSGAAIMDSLIAVSRRRDNIHFYENHIAVDLVVRDGRCCGVYVLDMGNQRVLAVNADAVILAAGGAGKVYLYSSTPWDTTGDGIGMAYRAGCQISNMEFIQFHPTCLYHPQSPTLLISEAVRGEGGRLVNEAGDNFTEAVHPEGDLAPRDIVARAIDAEMKQSGADCVYLDCRAHRNDFWRRRFPSIIEQCEKRGIHIPADRVPVVPAAHYCCGGVRTDIGGRTNIDGLYAVGETADSGLHGANRLASNSLLECVVMARQCASGLSASLSPAKTVIPPWDEHRISPPRERIMVAHNWHELRRIMWNYVGIVRSDERLQRARRRMEWIRGEIDEYYRAHIVSRDFLELRNLAQCAELIIEGALARRESRGLHYNLDCLNKDKHAADTVLTREDFDNRRHAVNGRCPFSGRYIVAGGIGEYRRLMVGFCNPGCCRRFTEAAANNFASAGADILAARRVLDDVIERRNDG